MSGPDGGNRDLLEAAAIFYAVLHKCEVPIQEEFFAKLPVLGDEMKAQFADKALEFVMLSAGRHPPQMQDLIIAWGVRVFIFTTVALSMGLNAKFAQYPPRFSLPV